MGKKNTDAPTIIDVLRLISKRDRIRLVARVVLRVLINFLDMAALLGVGVLAILLTSFASGDRVKEISLPLLGVLPVQLDSMLTVSCGVALTFLIKSFSAVLITHSLGVLIAEIEVAATRKLIAQRFNLGPMKMLAGTVELQQMIVTSVTALFTQMLSAATTIISEGTLLAILTVGFFVINPLAASGLLAYIGIVVLILHNIVANRIRSHASISYDSVIDLMEKTRDLCSVETEARLQDTTLSWISSIVKSKNDYSFSNVRALTLAGLPRHVVESSLILGTFVFIGAVVLFSDIPAQALTIGIFLTGGLRLVASVLPLQSAFTVFGQAGAVGRSAFELLSQIPSSPIQKSIPAGETGANFEEPEIEFRCVNFSYDGIHMLLKKNSFKVPFGAKFAVVGPSGAGKSTLLKLLVGELEPHSGDILIGGAQAREFIKSRPGIVGIVPQRPELVSGTLLTNITLSTERSTDDLDEAVSCLEMSGLKTLAEQLSADYDLDLASNGTSMSGGELQRLGIARALYRRPKILILDEATSALDARTERGITKALDALRGSMTIFLVAHRLSTVQNADLVLYLSDGGIKFVGKFDELIREVPEFAESVRLMGLGQGSKS